MRLAGLVEYDGAGFAGWAAQPGERTVEGELAAALGTVLRQPVKLSVAGRTDAGVHASGQVVSFEADTALAPSTLAYRATAVLPQDLAIRRCVARAGWLRRSQGRPREELRVPHRQRPRPLPAVARRATFVAQRLDFDRLQEAAALVRGTRDFRAFTPSRTYHVRFQRVVSESAWERRGDLLVYRTTADSFLYGMVRTLVGTMVEVGHGKREVASFARLLGGGERSEAGPALPSQGLTLVGVGYDELNFEEAGNDGR